MRTKKLKGFCKRVIALTLALALLLTGGAFSNVKVADAATKVKVNIYGLTGYTTDANGNAVPAYKLAYKGWVTDSGYITTCYGSDYSGFTSTIESSLYQNGILNAGNELGIAGQATQSDLLPLTGGKYAQYVIQGTATRVFTMAGTYASGAKTNLSQLSAGTYNIVPTFTRETISVSFDANGGALADDTVYTKNKYDTWRAGGWPANPTRTGYYFTGWSDANGNIINPDTQIPADATNQVLTANWSLSQYTVKLYSGRGIKCVSVDDDRTQKTRSIPVTYGQRVYHIAETSTDYVFKGWYWADENGNSTGELYTTDSFSSFIATSNVSLIAVAEEISYEQGTISVDTNGASSYYYKGSKKTASVQNVSIYMDSQTGRNVPSMFYAVKNPDTSSPYYIYDMTKTGYTLSGFDVVNSMKLSDGNTISSIIYGPTYQYSDIYFDAIGYGLYKGYSGEYTSLTKELLSGATAGVRAKWTPNSYTIQFKPNGGTGSMEDMSMTYDVPKQLDPCYFTKEGYECIGWATTEAKADAGKVDYKLDAYVSNLSSVDGGTITLYAVWAVAEHDFTLLAGEGIASVTANSETGKTAQVTVTHNNAASYSAEVEEGYTFSGWYDSNNNKVNSTYTTQSYTLTKDTALTAKAEYNGDCYIVFNGNGHDGGEMETQTATKKVATKLSANGFTKKGYTLSGWGTTPNDTTATYTDKGVITPVTDSLLLYAIWKPNTAKLSFESDFKDSGSMEDISYTYGTDAEFTVPKESGFVKTGYHVDRWVVFHPDFIAATKAAITAAGGVEKCFGTTFGGWNSKDMSEEAGVVTVAEPGDELKGVLTENVTYVAYPQWEANVYNISYNVPEGAVFDKVESYTYGVGAKLPSEVLYKDTVFLGWYSDEKCQGTNVTEISVTDIEDKTFTGLFYDPVKDEVIYPDTGDMTDEEKDKISDVVEKYGKDCPYLENLELNGGKLVSWVENWDSDIIMLPTKNNVVKDGHVLDGWYTNSDYSGDAVTSMEKSALDDGAKVYAKWEVAKYSISYNVPTGASIKDKVDSYTYGEAVVLPSEVDYKNAVFMGWYQDTKCQGMKVTEIAKTESGDKEFTGLFVNQETGEVVYPDTEDMTEEEKKELEDKIQDVVEGCPYMGNLVLNGGTVVYWVEDWNSKEISLPVAANLVKDGCTFGGWYKTADFSGEPVSSMKKLDLDAGYKAYAKWILSQGGTTPTQNPIQTVQPGENNTPVPGASNTPVPGTSQNPDASIEPSATPIPTADATTTPVVDAPYMDNLETNGGTVNKWDEDWNAEVIILPTDITRPGYEFGGWYTNSEFTGEPVTALTKVDLDNGVKVYAKWIPKTFSITYVLDGGVLNEAAATTVTNGVSVKLPKEVTKTGYVFGGWYTAADFSGSAVSETGNSVTDNLTYYARWTDEAVVTGDGLIWRISGTNTAALIGTKKRNIKKLVVPSKVTLTSDGVTKSYKVNRVKADAFSGCKKLATVTIGKNVTTIGAYAFKNCKQLKSVNIKSTKLLKICESAFNGDKKLKKIIIKSKKLNRVGKRALKGIHKKCVIKVPKTKVKKYKKLFKNKGQKKTVKIKK